MNPYNPTIPFPNKGNEKVGLTICLNQEEKDPFEVTIFFKNRKGESKENALSITASGKLTLNIGKSGYLELFGEKTKLISQNEKTEADDEMPVV